MSARVRDFHDDDLDQVVRLFELARSGTSPVYALSEVIASCQQDHAVIAVDGEQVIGAAVGRAAHAQGWIVFFFVDPGQEDADALCGRLVDALEQRMTPLGLGVLSVLVPDDAERLRLFGEQAFSIRSRVRYLERAMPVQRRELESLREVGGRVLPKGLWDKVSGMVREKSLLEDRLVAPLAEPDLAELYGVVPPRSVILFGPPGTGKTTFARATASRLGWPFVEVFPSRIADTSAGLANGLRSVFEAVRQLEHVVVFMDEVEEIASRRRGDPPSPTQAVTNELLKLIPEFRERSGRLLICATNFIRSLDPAFLRHGRFDYVIPIGLPDEEARGAIWSRYIPVGSAGHVDLRELARHSEGLTPADIEYAARRASQHALAAAINGAEGHAKSALRTADYLQALQHTRATVSSEAAAAFAEDIQTLARL